VNILAHRGQWGHNIAQNSSQSFSLAFNNGYGVETDLRDHNGDIVISHDMPDGASLSFADFLTLYKGANSSGMLALNVKADGLQKLAQKHLEEFDIGKDDYFFFDMSVPDALGYQKLGLSYFARLSEYEPVLMLGDEAKGIWVDIFKGCWFDSAFIKKHLDAGYKLALVSPELHKRGYIEAWEDWRNMLNGLNDEVDVKQVMLCTDFPNEAAEFFNGYN